MRAKTWAELNLKRGFASAFQMRHLGRPEHWLLSQRLLRPRAVPLHSRPVGPALSLNRRTPIRLETLESWLPPERLAAEAACSESEDGTQQDGCLSDQNLHRHELSYLAGRRRGVPDVSRGPPRPPQASPTAERHARRAYSVGGSGRVCRGGPRLPHARNLENGCRRSCSRSRLGPGLRL